MWRNSLRHRAGSQPDNDRLRLRLIALAVERWRFGYRSLHPLLRRVKTRYSLPHPLPRFNDGPPGRRPNESAVRPQTFELPKDPFRWALDWRARACLRTTSANSGE